MSKKRSKHHTIANAKKRKKRNKQSFWNRIMVPRIEAKKQKAEAKKKRDEALKKGLKKIEVTSKREKSPQKKGKTR